MNSNLAERLQWSALTVLGIVAGLALALPLGVPIFAVLGAMAGTPVVLGIVGLSLGTAQWPVIRRHISSSAWWVAGSAVGMAVGLTLGVILVEQIGRAVAGGPINFRMLGVPVNALSLGAGLACGSLLADALVLRTGSFASAAVLLVVGSGVAGACTAKALATVFKEQLEQVSAARRGDSRTTAARLSCRAAARHQAGRIFWMRSFRTIGPPLWLKFSGYVLNRNAGELEGHSLLCVCDIVVPLRQISPAHKTAGCRPCKIREGNRVSIGVGLIDESKTQLRARFALGDFCYWTARTADLRAKQRPPRSAPFAQKWPWQWNLRRGARTPRHRPLHSRG